jgi:adenylate cyclase
MGKKSASGGGQRAKEPPGAIPAPPSGPEAVAPSAAPAPHGHGHHPHIEFKFFEELKHRNVVRVAVLYLLACWLILDPVHVVFHMLEVPAWANRLVVVLMAVGFPAVLLFAWAFEITPEGLKPTVEVDPKRSIRTLTGRRLDRAIIVVLVLALGYFVADKFWLAKPPETTPPAPLPPAAIAVPDKSIAVLPFVDMSEKKDQEYFSDGLTEELIDRLSHSPELKVIARTSSFSFKGKSEDVRAIASKLGVANLLEGSVRKAGNELRITAQLIRAADGTHLWSQTYNRKLDDVFRIQDEIAEAVVRSLRVSLLEGTMPSAIGTQDMEAYTLYVQARSIFVRAGTQAEWEKVVDYLQEAIKLDPSFAPAWAWLSRARTEQIDQRYVPSQQGWEEARRAAEKALALDPKLSEAHIAMAKIQMWYDHDWVGAQGQVRQALELDPSSWSALNYAAQFAKAMGHADKAVEFFQRIVASDPLNAIAYANLGWGLYRAGRLSEAAVALRKALDLNPKFERARMGAGLVLLASGDPAGALAEFERLNDDGYGRAYRALAYHALGRKADVDAVLADLETRYAERDAYLIAAVHADRGEIDQAFGWLDRAYRQHDIDCVNVKVDPLLKNLRDDARYKKFLRKMKLPE